LSEHEASPLVSPDALSGQSSSRYQNPSAKFYLFDFGSKARGVRRNIGQRR
jgi:hypothetical protein